MSSARYTSRLKLIAEAQNKKVQITNRQGSLNKVISAIGCSPNYSRIKFIQVKCCSYIPPEPECYSLSILQGGLYNSLPSLFMDGGLPNFNGICNINPSICYNNFSLQGGLYNSLPSLFMDGGLPNFNGICNINPSICYNNFSLQGGLYNSLPSLFMDGGLPNFNGICRINQ